MEAVKERAARCNRATPARTSSRRPACGSRNASITRRRRRAKYQIRRLALLLVACLLLTGLTVAVRSLSGTRPAQDTPAHEQASAEVPAAITSTSTSSLTSAEPAAPAARYPLTDSERDTVERVVMAEAGGESLEGQMLVAQCILNAAEKRGIQPSEAVEVYHYTQSRPEPTERVREAVAAVFDRGETVTDDPVLNFYNPALVRSDFHERQIFVIEVGGHRFFAERSTKQ